jgi:glutathionylspermidine synthase
MTVVIVLTGDQLRLISRLLDQSHVKHDMIQDQDDYNLLEEALATINQTLAEHEKLSLHSRQETKEDP